MSVVKDSFLDLEKRRRQLEQNLQELQGLLRHWQTWEAEYEGLKEEIEILGDDSPLKELEAVTSTYEGTLLTPDEISKLVKDGNGKQRDSSQIISLISRRMDYVQENVKTVQKKYDAAESKLAAVSVVMQPEARDEDGLPLTEITEELDEDDNVISSVLKRPGDSAPQILEALRKQGINDLPDDSSSGLDTGSEKKVLESASAEPEASEQPQDESVTTRPRSGSAKKSVSFAESTKPSSDTGSSFGPAKPNTPKTVHQDVTEKLAEEIPLTNPVIPENETVEQAAIRQEMLQYNMNDIGSIVAEINLDEQDGEVYDYSDESDGSDDEVQDSEMSEDEDKYGRTRVRVVSDKYREEMLALERKLNAKSMVNAGPDGDESNIEPSDKPLKPTLVTPEDKGEASSKKGVRFSESLDVQDAPIPETKIAATDNLMKEGPLADNIVERTDVKEKHSSPPIKPKKISAFKAAKMKESSIVDNNQKPQMVSDIVSNGPLAGLKATQLKPAAQATKSPFNTIPKDVPAPRTVPEGPVGKTLADQLIERPSDPSDEVQEPDEFDETLMRQEIAAQYHVMRNRMIQQNGGFQKPEDEDPEADEGRPRVSRFKAARLAKQGS